MDKDLKVVTDCGTLTSEQRINKIKLLRIEAKRIENYEVDRIMGFNGVVNNEISDGEQFANLACDNANNCNLCSSLYFGHIIASRKDLSDPYVFSEWLRCYSVKAVQGGSRNNATSGVYGIICTKGDCKNRGIVYVGSAGDIRDRVGKHKNNIITITSASQAVHRHFIDHGQGVEIPPEERLQHFACVILEEVGQEQSLEREQYFMEKFGTLYYYGFNEKRAVKTEVEREPEAPSTYIPKKRAKPTPLKPIDRTIPEKILFALALKNHPNPIDINTHETANLEQIKRFGTCYFNENPFTHFMGVNMNKNINPSSNSGHFLNPATTYCSASVLDRNIDPTLPKLTYTSFPGYQEGDNWFRWASQSKFITEGKSPSRYHPYVYGFKLEEVDEAHPDFNSRRPIHEQAITDEIEAERDIIQEMLKDPDNLDSMLAGTLPLAPVVFSKMVKRLS